MGSGIMAHFANAGVDVVMLDIVPPGLSDKEKGDPAKRNQFAAGGLQGALKARPAAFFHPVYARRVTIGNLQDDIDLLKGCDLVIEAIIENVDIKRSLFEKLENTVPSSPRTRRGFASLTCCRDGATRFVGTSW